jgi:hypothetical protein
LLRNGWEKHFGGTKAMIWLLAINPMKLLELVETPNGKQWMRQLFEREGYWDRVIAKGKRRLAETRAMQRKAKRVEAWRKAQELENAKRMRSESP